MNIDIDLINRSLIDAGEAPLTDADITDNADRYRIIKAMYLPTILETLANTEWTSRKKRAALTALTVPYLPDEYSYAFSLPADCARAVSIEKNAAYLVEGTVLFCNVADPHLMYISNGRIAKEADYITADIYPAYSLDISDDPLLEHYIEMKIASKVAKNIKGNEKLFGVLYQEAAADEDRAERASRRAARSRKNGRAYWVDELGLSDPTEGNYADN